MHVTIKTTGFELTPAIESYVRDKFQAVERLIQEDPEQGRIATLAVEVGKTTDHHKNGDVFRAEAMLSFSGEVFRTEESLNDLYAAVDVTKDEMVQVLSKQKAKKVSMFRRGARAIKRILRRE